MKQIHLFTSSACNYIPKVRLLFQSIRKFHPDWILHLALADELKPEIDLSQEPFDKIWPIAELGIPHWKAWAFCHNIVELATAIKPFTLLRLMELPETSNIIYLDPDTVVFSHLNDIITALNESTFLLTPHLTEPEETLNAVMDNEICALKHGVYNLGFLGITINDESRRFANWWANRLYHFCRADIKNGLFTDQRWIDLVPAFFEGVAIMRSPRHNVASWNLTHRHLSGDFERGFFVNDEPLGFYHFTGFDSGAHDLMVIKNIGTNKSVTMLLNWYQKQTQELSKDPLAQIPWAFARFSDGTLVEPIQRIVYRERQDLQQAFPDPFDANGFLAWWRMQAPVEYPSLFKNGTDSSEIEKLFGRLSPGYLGTDIRPNSIKKLLKTAVSNPKIMSNLLQKTWYILKHEGITGIKRRI
jgi:hypothetical protein